MKRILAVILSLMMVFTTLGTVTFAAGGATNVSFTVDKTTAAVGDTITVTVSNGAMTVESFTCGFKFDKEKLECKSISGPDSSKPHIFKIYDKDGESTKATAVSSTDDSNMAGTVGIAFAGTANVDYKAGVLLTATFEVKATGDAAFTLYEDTGGTDRFKSDAITTKTVSIAKAPISSVTASVNEPVAGQPLDFAGTVDGSAPYSITKVEWFESTNASGTPVTAPATAKAKQFYYARITLTAKPGETFAESLDNTVSGDYSVTRNGDTELYLTKAYPKTGSLPAASVTAAPTAKSLKYNGSDQELVNAGTAPNGIMHYSLDNATWSTAIPKGKNAGDYTVYYKAVGNSGYSDSAVASISATIGQKNISTVTIDPIPDQTYTGNAITPDPEVKDGTTTLKKGTDYTVSYDKNKYVGTNTAKLTITGKGNYTGTKSANFTIVAADQNPTFTTPVDLVTGGHRLNLTTLVDGAKGDMIFTITSGNAANLETGNTLVSTGTTGVVKIKVSIAAKDVNDDTINEYNAFSKSDAITVNVVATPAASVTAAPTAKTGLKYNGNDQALVSKGTANGGTMQYSLDNSTWSDAIPKGKDAKTYTVYYKVKGDSDHTDFTPTSNTVSVSIAQKEVTVAPGTYKVSKEYDSTTTAGTGNGTLSVTGIVDSGVSVTATPVAYTSANVGGQSNVEVNLTLSGTGSANYKLAASKISVPCSITPATLTVTPDANQSKKFKEADPALTYTYSGNASGQTPAFSGKLDREAGENVGTYAIKLGNLALTDSGAFKASNYTLKLSSPTVNFEIKKTDAPVPTGLKGVKGNELATVVLPTGWEWKASNTTMDNLGSHPFKAKYTDTTGNYNNATDVDVTVEVLAKTGVSSSITFPNGKLVYNGHGQEYKKATISGITAGDTPNWTYTYAVDSSTTATLNSSGLPLTVGKYKVTAIYEDSANYGTATATLEITPAKPTGTPTFTKITEKGKTLANANLGMGTLTPTGGTLEWVAGDTTVVEANKAYEWKYTPANPNYAPVTGTIVVYPVSTGIVIYSPCYTIKASAGANGSISPAGWCSVVENGSQTFTFTPDKGYTVAKVLVDGKSVGAVKSYTFKDVTKDHTIEVIFMKSNGNPATGVFVMP